MEKSKCPICGKKFVDILKHFALDHEIKDMNQFEQLVSECEKNEQKKTSFRNYVEGLKLKLSLGMISPEEYRESMMKWCKEN